MGGFGIDLKDKCPHRAGLTLGQIPRCTELEASQMPRDYPEGMGGFGIDWYISRYFYGIFRNQLF